MVGLFKRVTKAVKPKPLSPAAQALSDAWHEHVEFYPDDAAFELMAAAVLRAGSSC